MSNKRWTRFYDMHSGGYQKEKWEIIFIEAPEYEAIRIFEDKFCHNPLDVACECCGENYSITEYTSLEQATGYYRNCKFDRTTMEYIEGQAEYKNSEYITLEEYKKKSNILILHS